MVMAIHTVETVSTRSTTYSVWYSAAMAPPSWLIMWLRLKPVAIFCSRVGSGSRSPAICSIVNSSKGLFSLNDRITQSRQCHMSRRPSMWKPWVSA